MDVKMDVKVCKKHRGMKRDFLKKINVKYGRKKFILIELLKKYYKKGKNKCLLKCVLEWNKFCGSDYLGMEIGKEGIRIFLDNMEMLGWYSSLFVMQIGYVVVRTRWNLDEWYGIYRRYKKYSDAKLFGNFLSYCMCYIEKEEAISKIMRNCYKNYLKKEEVNWVFEI